jgi:hypothetical protein
VGNNVNNFSRKQLPVCLVRMKDVLGDLPGAKINEGKENSFKLERSCFSIVVGCR